MLALPARTAIFAVTALTLTASFAISQQPAPAEAPGAAAAPQASAPPARRMRPMAHGPMMRSGFRSGPSRHFDGERGRMEMGSFHMGPGGMWWNNPRIAERLSLTAEQTRKMDDIVEQSRLQLIDLRANLEKQQVMLGPIMDANPVDAAKASAQIDKVADARADLEKANAKMLLSIRGVLTPDQWTKLHERPTAQGAAPAGGSGAAAAPDAGGGHWRGGRPGGPGGNGKDDIAPSIDAQ